jgi:hypothetical protein
MSEEIEYVYLVGIADGNWHDVATPHAFKTYKAARDSITGSIDRHIERQPAKLRLSSSEQPGCSYTVSVLDIDDNDRMITGFWLKRVQVSSKW